MKRSGQKRTGHGYGLVASVVLWDVNDSLRPSSEVATRLSSWAVTSIGVEPTRGVSPGETLMT
jgi:hypothetical protein